MSRMRWVWLLVVPLLLSPSGVAHANPPGDADTVSVTGDVRHPMTLTLDALRAYPPRTQSVTFESSAGAQTHTYEGAALLDVVTAADPSVDAGEKHPLLAFTILATGADGYSAAVSWGEISPDLAATPVIVADTEDGEPLEQPRLVVPGDVEGARYVSDLTELRVVNLATMPR
jgi:DMSO/TMAO reductase YedYZ molybdopterin-dependent catalytic subunit